MRAIINPIKQIFQLLVRVKAVDYILVILALLLGAILNWEMHDIAFLMAMTWFVMHPWKREYYALTALILIFLVPILILLSRERYASEIVIYGYYFLVFAVIAGVAEVRHEQTNNS